MNIDLHRGEPFAMASPGASLGRAAAVASMRLCSGPWRRRHSFRMGAAEDIA